MKKFIQLILILILIFFFYVLYNKYFLGTKKNDVNQKNDKIIKNNFSKKRNQIKNLKYEINFDQKQKYIINSELSEIINDGDTELIYMKNVNAKFFNSDGSTISLYSDTAEYNNINYNSIFKKNVKIVYKDTKINADKVEMFATKKKIYIRDNVNYYDQNVNLQADVVLIDLESNLIEIFMNNKIKDVTIKKNLINE
jgi:hypothetical protein